MPACCSVGDGDSTMHSIMGTRFFLSREPLFVRCKYILKHPHVTKRRNVSNFSPKFPFPLSCLAMQSKPLRIEYNNGSQKVPVSSIPKLLGHLSGIWDLKFFSSKLLFVKGNVKVDISSLR